MVSKEEVQKIAHLSRLNIKEDQVEAMQNHFNNIIKHFKSLEKIETKGVNPLVTPHSLFPPLREDQEKKDLQASEVLSNAPEVKDGLFKVPPVV